jgi:HEXXH motif-containing protein
MIHFDPYVPADCSGLCLPESGGNTVDILRGISARNCGARIRQRIDQAFPLVNDPDERRLLQATADGIDSLDPLALSIVFDPLPASADSPLIVVGEDAMVNPRPDLARALGAVRYLVGAPQVRSLTLVLPRSVIPPAGLYLPHLRLLLLPPGPVAVVIREGATRFTWPDGAAVTLPCGTSEGFERVRGRRMLRLSGIQDFPVLNAAPEIAESAAAFGVCDPVELPQGVSRIAAGLSTLRNIWPAAAGAAARHLKGLLVLAKRGHSRSHSPLLFQGMVLLSPEDPVMVGDLLVHELSHVRLNLFREFDPVFHDREPERRHISPWRGDLRPLSGLVLGVHAFLNVCHYYRRVSEIHVAGGTAAALFERQREKVRVAWAAAQPFLLPTPAGAAFLETLEQEVMAL